MKITKGQLRQIIREELDAMGAMLRSDMPHSRHTKQVARGADMAGVPSKKVRDILDSILGKVAVDAQLYDAMVDANSGVKSRSVRMEEGEEEPSDEKPE